MSNATGAIRLDLPGGDSIPVAFDPATAGDGDTLFVCAHGAGGNMNDRGVTSVAKELCARGIAVVRFNFGYKERGARYPDAIQRVVPEVAAVAEWARTNHPAKKLIIGGRSFGGRAASMLAAEGFACDGLVLLAYPLHAPGKTTQLRDAHLPRIGVPVLCFNGTRDTFCERPLMERVVAPLAPRWTMHWLEGADHSFHVLKSSGRKDADVLREIGDATANWVAAVGTQP